MSQNGLPPENSDIKNIPFGAITKFKDGANESEIMAEMIMESEEKVIKDVLRQLLKREPNVNDARKVIRVFSSDLPVSYKLFYSDINLGEVRYHFEENKVYFDMGGVASSQPYIRVSFTPS